MEQFITKDSGKRDEYESGMRRDIQTGKARPDLVPPLIRNIFNMYIDRIVNHEKLPSLNLSSLNNGIEIVALGGNSSNDLQLLIENLIAYEIKTNGETVQSVAEVYYRLAGLYGRGAAKYGENNWQKATLAGEEYLRFKQSTSRHWLQYLSGQKDEDHFCAVIFNLYGIGYVTEEEFKC